MGHLRRFMRKPWYFSGLSAHFCPSRSPSRISHSRRDLRDPLRRLGDLPPGGAPPGAALDDTLLLKSTCELDMDTLSSLPS